MNVQADIKKAMKEKTLVIGTRQVLKEVRTGKVGTIILASNCPKNLRADMTHYSGISGISINDFGLDSLRMGEFCGKPFNILMIGIKK